MTEENNDHRPTGKPYSSENREKSGKIWRDNRSSMSDDDDALPRVRYTDHVLSLIGQIILIAGSDIRVPPDQKEIIADFRFLRELRLKEAARRAQMKKFLNLAIGAVITGAIGALFLWAGNIFPHIGIK